MGEGRGCRESVRENQGCAERLIRGGGEVEIGGCGKGFLSREEGVGEVGIGACG